MQTKVRTRMLLLAGAALPLVGCPQTLTRPIVFQLGQGLGQFDVQTNVAVRQSRLVMLDTGGITLGTGSLEIDPTVISITPTQSGGGKLQLLLQGTTTLQITAWVASAEELATVFETGDQYGPYMVLFDEDLQPVSVSPSRINLTDRTIDLLNGGEFSLGLEVVSPIDGSVTILSLTFNLGLGHAAGSESMSQG